MSSRMPSWLFEVPASRAIEGVVCRKRARCHQREDIESVHVLTSSNRQSVSRRRAYDTGMISQLSMPSVLNA